MYYCVGLRDYYATLVVLNKDLYNRRPNNTNIIITMVPWSLYSIYST